MNEGTVSDSLKQVLDSFIDGVGNREGIVIGLRDVKSVELQTARAYVTTRATRHAERQNELIKLLLNAEIYNVLADTAGVPEENNIGLPTDWIDRATKLRKATMK